MAIHKCLHCRGLDNSRTLKLIYNWMLVTIKVEASYHLVRIGHALNRPGAVETTWTGRTACGLDFVHEVSRD